MKPVLFIVIPCYNEEKVLPITSTMFLNKINERKRQIRMCSEIFRVFL